MKKMILAAVGLLLGLAAGTGWAVVTHEAPPLPAVDSLAAHGETVPVAETDDHGVAEASPPAGVSADPRAEHDANPSIPPAQNGSLDSDEAVPAAMLPDAGAMASGADPQGDSGADQLARIFAAMQPRDAARVLSHLRDNEIRDVLTLMAPRQAAAVLSNMEPGRAAVLSRSVLEREDTP